MLSLLNRSLATAKQARHDQDALTVGASVFFGVPYEDVTQEQRASWKFATSDIRYSGARPEVTAP